VKLRLYRILCDDYDADKVDTYLSYTNWSDYAEDQHESDILFALYEKNHDEIAVSIFEMILEDPAFEDVVLNGEY